MSALPELLRIAERDGTVTPEAVLEDARSEDSPLHRFFEWDDGAAAERYRLDQAAGLIRRYTVEIETQPETIIRTRALVNVGPRSYVPIDQAMRDPGMRDVVMQSAIRELSSLRRKYEHLCDFDAAIQAAAAQKQGAA
jgi:hypothetical protein